MMHYLKGECYSMNTLEQGHHRLLLEIEILSDVNV